MSHPLLSSPYRVSPRALRVGQYVYRESANGENGGWYRVVATEWVPLSRGGRWYIQIEVPEKLRNLLADHYHLTAQKPVTVRDVAPAPTPVVSSAQGSLLLGGTDEPVRCRVLNGVAVHWWPEPALPGMSCLCGERVKESEEERA